MSKNWYTVFLLVSLMVAGCYSGTQKLYAVQKYFYEQQSQKTEPAEEEKPLEETPLEETKTEEKTDSDSEGSLSGNHAEETKHPEETKLSQDSFPMTESTGKETEKIAALFGTEFQDVLLIGDSRTVGLYEYGQVKKAEAFADNGMSVFNLWKKEVSMGQGEKMTLEQVLSQKQYHAIHFMLGINELGYSKDQVVKKYRESVEKVQQMQPFAKLVLGANLHVTAEKSEKDPIFNNENINELNQQIRKIAESLDCYYLDVNVLFDDAGGNLGKEYSTDGAHVLGKYYMDWVQWIQSGGSKESGDPAAISGNSLLDAPS